MRIPQQSSEKRNEKEKEMKKKKTIRKKPVHIQGIDPAAAPTCVFHKEKEKK